MKIIAGYLMIGCVVIGGCLGWPLAAKGEEHPPEHPVAGQEWYDPVSGIDVVWVPAGCFQMGCVSGIDCEDDEEPIHEVCVDGFWMGKYEVTQAQWRQVMGDNPSWFVGDNTDLHPVDSVTWNDVQAFLSKLNQKAGKAIYRMPNSLTTSLFFLQNLYQFSIEICHYPCEGLEPSQGFCEHPHDAFE